MRKSTLVGILCAAAFVFASQARAQPACEFTTIDTLDADNGTVWGLNNRGQAVGDLFYGKPQYVSSAFVWQRGHTRLLPPLAPGQSAGATGINDTGRSVGWSGSEQGTVPVTWFRDRVAQLAASQQATATAINDRGQVIGNTFDGDCLFWPSVDSDPIVLPGLGGDSCFAHAVSEQGTVVGDVRTADGRNTAFIWADGTMQDVGPADIFSSSLTDIQAFGLAVGVAFMNDGPHAMLHSRGRTRVFDQLGTAEAVNAWGTIAALDFTVEQADSHLLLGDRFGNFRDWGTLGGEVASSELFMNNHFQIAWNPQPVDQPGPLPPHFCQLDLSHH